MDYLFVIGGLVGLLLGGEMLVRGAVALAQRLEIPPLVIGLTIVGFGTSMPELVTSLQAALVGAPGIALGNVVGSNTANILLILGVSAVLAPVIVGSAAFKR
ncbi:MAG: sodium:calcium antiporter, partial [Rhodobacteraceae bacterium]|nr:sodium:calcium antiporter [Paracoccaceae bacterium]